MGYWDSNSNNPVLQGILYSIVNFEGIETKQKNNKQKLPYLLFYANTLGYQELNFQRYYNNMSKYPKFLNFII